MTDKERIAELVEALREIAYGSWHFTEMSSELGRRMAIAKMALEAVETAPPQYEREG